MIIQAFLSVYSRLDLPPHIRFPPFIMNLNAVYVYGDAVGETMFYGPGVGKLPTATAVVSDLIAVIKNIRLGTSGKAYVQPQFSKQVKSKKEQLTKKYIRLHVLDSQPGMLMEMTTIFAQYDISFDQIIQRASDQDKERKVLMTNDYGSAKNTLRIKTKMHLENDQPY